MAKMVWVIVFTNLHLLFGRISETKKQTQIHLIAEFFSIVLKWK